MNFKKSDLTLINWRKGLLRIAGVFYAVLFAMVLIIVGTNLVREWTGSCAQTLAKGDPERQQRIEDCKAHLRDIRVATPEYSEQLARRLGLPVEADGPRAVACRGLVAEPSEKFEYRSTTATERLNCIAPTDIFDELVIRLIAIGVVVPLVLTAVFLAILVSWRIGRWIWQGFATEKPRSD